jgi:ferredoxin
MPNHASDMITYTSIAKEALQQVFDALHHAGYTLVGPRASVDAIVHTEILHVNDLPVGVTEKQEAGTYELIERDDRALFGYAVGPQSWKSQLFPPDLRLFSVERQDATFTVTADHPDTILYAFIGVRPCDLHAMTIQDLNFLNGPYPDPSFKTRRQRAFIVAVNCLKPGGTCFCASMHTGPKAGSGFDLALTELDEIFIVELGSEMGKQIMAEIDWRPAGAFELRAARQALTESATQMGRQLDTSDLPNLLYQNLDHPRWDHVAKRCLSCTNCTQVCPTCFCCDIIEKNSLDGKNTERWRLWDSCFNLNFSHVHGGNIRPSTRSRYRQWLTHKLASWIDQFGISGCVGCGRCITWCPVGIDITEEVHAFRTGEPAR